MIINKKVYKNSLVILISLASSFLGIGIFIGWLFFGYRLNEKKLKQNSVAVRESGYVFTNPLLECEGAEESFVELKPFKEKLIEIVEKKKRERKAEYISVYFRDLNNGPWFGINEKDEFSPASLLKVPVMIAYFKLAERSPEMLQKSIIATKEDLEEENNGTSLLQEKLEVGKAYTAEELIFRMIVYSDNVSARLLIGNLDANVLAKIYSDFAININDILEGKPQVSVKAYAGFFRMLFNSSYLNREYSEKALEILSQVVYKDALSAGVSKDVVVSHKFGERGFGEAKKQLHDCGIVYIPKHPYLACIMTRGENISELTTTIKDISQTIFKEVEDQVKN